MHFMCFHCEMFPPSFSYFFSFIFSLLYILFHHVKCGFSYESAFIFFYLWGIFHSFCRQKLLARRVPRTQQLAFAAKCIQSSIMGRGRPTVLRQFSVSNDVVRKTNALQRKRGWQRFLNAVFHVFITCLEQKMMPPSFHRHHNNYKKSSPQFELKNTDRSTNVN